MDIDKKNIQAFLWRVLNFVIEACYNIVQAYPKTSIGTITVLFLYVFLPLVLVFLVCCLIACGIGVVVYRVYFRDDLEGFDKIWGYKKTDEKSPITRENEMGKNVISLGQSEKPRRRKVNEKDGESYNAQRSNVEKDVGRRGGTNDDLFDKTAVVEEDLKEIREVNTHPGKKKARPPSRQTSEIVASPPFTSGSLEEGPDFSGVKGEDEDSSDDSDGHEDRNKAVEWSFDDQMNLSHVGNIEIERNTRLENLIARRRARKLLDIHVRNTLMRPATSDSRDRIPSIITARKNHFLSSGSELSPIPGSAPSVLLPMHKSPFDISFDPEKEKPIPTGESFEKEILADQQKEATFCRHESFGRNTFSPMKKSLQDRANHDFTFHHGPIDKNEISRVVHQPESSHGNEEDGTEVKQIVHEKINERSRSSSSSEEDIPLSGADKDKLLKSLSSLAQKDTDSERDEEVHVPYNTDRLLYEKTAGNSFFGEKRALHAPSNSLASDLQVEVSEVGSPHSTSSNEKSNIFDDYVNKEVTSGGEDMNESNMREINEVSEKDITDAGVSSTNHNLDSNASDLQPEKVVQQEESSSHSQPSHSADSIQGQTTDVQPDHHASSDAPDAPSKNDLEDSAKEVIANTSTFDKLKEAYPEEVNVVEESVVHNNDASESSKSREVIEPEAIAGVSAPVEGINSESLKEVSDEKDPSLLQDIPTQDREEGNASSHNDKSVTIENETHSKSESAKDDSTLIPNEAVVASEQVDLNGDSGKTMGHMEVKEQLDPHQGDLTVEGNIVSNDNETANSAAEEDIRPASEATKKDDNETIKNSAAEETASEASKDDNETVNSVPEANEKEPASVEETKSRTWKFF
ncbi:hypothetical protein ACET3Z_005883 [Daucus carota]